MVKKFSFFFFATILPTISLAAEHGTLKLWTQKARQSSAAGVRVRLRMPFVSTSVPETFPTSPLAGGALWRAADIQWQLEKAANILPRPSSCVANLNEVEKRFPKTKWSDLAAYDLLDQLLCGDWKGTPGCPERESDLYEIYVHDHPQSSKAAEALYNAAWRQAALVDVYGANNEKDKSSNSRKKAISLAQKVVTQYAKQSDWTPRALDLKYKLEQNVSVFGNQAE